MPEVMIRDADPESDAAACAAIYAPYVTDTIISFEEVPPSAAQMAGRIRASHVWLVAETNGSVVGFAFGSRHRERAAYRWAADLGVYVDGGHHRGGIGRELYRHLIQRLGAVGLRTLCAGVAQPNAASNGLHEALGFEPVGTYRRIGWKNGAWHDVRWFQLDLRPGDDAPPGAVGAQASALS
jgi:L-amino acid N-acyltransferase YncA